MIQNRKSQSIETKTLLATLKSYLSIISLNVNGLNAPINHHRVADWIKRHDPSIAVYKRLILSLKIHSDRK